MQLNTMHFISLTFCLAISLSFARVHDVFRLQGGRDPEPGEIKYIVVVKSYKTFCGGGIIGKKYILTAAHCVKVNQTTGQLLQPMKIIAGTNNVFNYTKSLVIIRNVSRAYLPAVYEKGGKYDIAVLELKKSLKLKKFSHLIKKLSLPEPLSNDSSTYPTYERARVKFAGYGNTHAEIVKLANGTTQIKRSGAGRLQVAKAIINDAQTCRRHYYNVRRAEMCLTVVEHKSKLNPQGTCSGDSGSPAVYNNSVLIGLDSRGMWCDNNLKPTIFTRVSSYIPFIKKAMKGITDDLVVYEA